MKKSPRKKSLVKKKNFVPLKNGDLKDVPVIQGHYDEIHDWKMDPKGYFLIKIDRKNKEIILAHCKKIGVISTVIKGKKPQDLYYEVHKKKLISTIDHAAYLGKELEKAYVALRTRKRYTQDKELNFR